MYAHSLKRTLRRQEGRQSEYTTFLKGMDSSSVRLDYTEDFEFITSVSLCHGRCGEGNGNTICKQLKLTACYKQINCGNHLTSMKIVIDRKIELRKKKKTKVKI